MKILVDLNHPAHFHLFHNVVKELSKSNTIIITAKEKDVLLSLLRSNGFDPYILQNKKRKDNLIHSALGLIKRDYKLLGIIRKENPDLLIGTSISITHTGKLMGIPSLYFGEDGYKAVPLSYRIGYPFASNIISPKCTEVGRFKHKKIEYNGYHELSYLSPSVFTPSEIVIEKYGLSKLSDYFLIRFSALTAHHDIGKRGISPDFAKKIIKLLSRHGKVLVSSEKALPDDIDEYRLNIAPEDIHHVMAYSKMLIGDSQTMSAESAVLGVPSIRYSSFVGQLMYLEELENEYGLTFGFLPGQENELLYKIKELLNLNYQKISESHKRMLNDKINVKDFFVWLIENYPESVKIMKENPNYQYRFK